MHVKVAVAELKTRVPPTQTFTQQQQQQHHHHLQQKQVKEEEEEENNELRKELL